MLLPPESADAHLSTESPEMSKLSDCERGASDCKRQAWWRLNLASSCTPTDRDTRSSLVGVHVGVRVPLVVHVQIGIAVRLRGDRHRQRLLRRNERENKFSNSGHTLSSRFEQLGDLHREGCRRIDIGSRRIVPAAPRLDMADQPKDKEAEGEPINLAENAKRVIVERDKHNQRAQIHVDRVTAVKEAG